MREGVVMNVSAPARRQQIERELRSNPDRSNREIARLLGVDHKTVGRIRGVVETRADAKNGELGNSPKPSGEIVGTCPGGEIPHGREIDHGHRDERFNWADVPDDAYMIPAQGLTAAFIEKPTGDLVITQDHSHLWSDDVTIRVSAAEVASFVQALADTVRATHG
jgi:hypothetical protein